VSEGWFFRGRKGLPTELAEMQVRVEELARSQGLDFCPVIYEVCDYDEINMIASYGGFPIRYPHWRFGMDFLQMQKGYEYGLQKIYEMVINTNPSYAYLLDNNTMMDPKLVMASTSSPTTPGSSRPTARCSTRWQTTPPRSGASSTGSACQPSKSSSTPACRSRT
jgi:SpoVR like protein